MTLPLHEPAVRRELTRLDPMMFAYVYLRKAITGQDGSVSFAECHHEWAELALSWVNEQTKPQQNRHAFFAPRSTGKSTWWLKILPLWAAAHGHVKFAAIFADTTTQARQHAASFRRELDNNALLRRDFPKLCESAKRTGGKAETDTVDLMVRGNGFVLAARGMDSSTLGMKVGDQRPDLLLIDDPEPDESNYSLMQMEKRLSTLTDAILPLNIFANVVYSGTVTMAGSIAHQMIKHVKGLEKSEWIDEQGFNVHHHPALRTDNEGERRSLWPEKWSLEFLLSIEHTRQYAKNYANDPMGADGEFWRLDDFQYGDFVDLSIVDHDSVIPPTKTIISVDPAVTVKQSSDFTGISVIGYHSGQKRCVVYEALQVKLGPEDLRKKLLSLCTQHPRVSEILVEDNQWKGLWSRLLHDMTVEGRRIKVTPKSAGSKSKEVRASDALNHYQVGRVLHIRKLRDLEEQMVSFPKAPHDDMVDSVAQGVNYFMTNGPARMVLPSQMSQRSRL